MEVRFIEGTFSLIYILSKLKNINNFTEYTLYKLLIKIFKNLNELNHKNNYQIFKFIEKKFFYYELKKILNYKKCGPTLICSNQVSKLLNKKSYFRDKHIKLYILYMLYTFFYSKIGTFWTK